jgi:NAD+ diphosphatase
VSPATRWLLFNSGQPLVSATADNSTKRNIVYLTTNDVRPFLGSEPFFGQGKDKGQLVIESSDVPHSSTEAARHHDIPVVFLGIHEPPSKSSALPSSDFANPTAAVSNLEGTPYFSMDISDLELTPEKLQGILDSTSQAQNGLLDWSEPRVIMSSLDGFSGGLFAEARSLVDWNQRNKVCLEAFLSISTDCPI